MFNGKIVLITGASRGIGAECARQFAAQGAQVAVHYHRNLEAARSVHSSLPGGPHQIVQADIANPEAVQRMVESVVGELGDLHILVNNAGIFAEHPVAAVDYAAWQTQWHQIIQTNLVGAANAAYCAARHMIERGGGGRIVNVSSRGAFRGEPEAPAYGASKAGMNAMSQSLAKALGPYNIAVTVVAPGWVETEMASAHLTGPDGDSIRNQSPTGRVATPADVAYTVLALAADKAEFLTGTIVDVNGASYLRS
jgi:3-oxoacyl-[acyl-carrier protein] reductase